VNVVVDQNHSRLFAPEICEDGVAQPARVGQQRLRALDLREPRLVSGRCNNQQLEWPASVVRPSVSMRTKRLRWASRFMYPLTCFQSASRESVPGSNQERRLGG